MRSDKAPEILSDFYYYVGLVSLDFEFTQPGCDPDATFIKLVSVIAHRPHATGYRPRSGDGGPRATDHGPQVIGHSTGRRP